MENHVFSPLYVAKLPINGIYALNLSTLELANPVISEIGAIPAAALSYLQTINQSLVLSMNKSQKSSYTLEMKVLDKERDADIAEIKRVTSSYLRSSDPVKKAAAFAKHLFLAPYWGMATLAQDIETGVVAEMLMKYKGRPDLLEAAQTLGITSLFATLEAKNTAFNTEFMNRNTEYAERDLAASNLKPAATLAYIQFCTAIEQAVNFTPNDTLIALFNKMDELRKNYREQEGGGKDEPATDEPTK
ncbi:MAG: DUF6261 family protein [Paludibacter sp.]